jgi:hypothetical protein
MGMGLAGKGKGGGNGGEGEVAKRVLFSYLKGLSHQFESGYKWYGWMVRLQNFNYSKKWFLSK